MRTQFRFFGITLMVTGLLASATRSVAVPIQGEISFAGKVALKKDHGASSATYNDVTYLDFDDPSISSLPVILSTTGTFDMLGAAPYLESAIHVYDLDLDAFSAPFKLWTTDPNGYFEFFLQNVSYERLDTPVGGGFDALRIIGSGYATSSLSEFDATPGTFEFITQGRGTVNVIFAATTIVAPPIQAPLEENPTAVPDAGGTLLLLSFAMSGICVARRKFGQAM